MPNASSAVRSCRLGALLLLAALPLAGLTLGSRSDPAPLAGPTIVSTVPANATVQVSLTAVLQVAFSEPMNESSVNASVLISPPATYVISWPSAGLLELQPTPALANCTVYTVRVDGTNATGAPLAPGPVPNPWSFMTACSKPFILSTTPLDRSTAVRVDTDIVVRFSERMDCSTNVTTAVHISNMVPPLPPPGSVSTQCDPAGTTWTYHLLAGQAFNASTTYTVTVSGDDLSGTALVPGLVSNPWSFSTNAPPTVSKPYLDRAGCLDANTDVLVAWNMSDNETPVSSLVVRLSFLNNASAWETITGPRAGFSAFKSGESSFGACLR